MLLYTLAEVRGISTFFGTLCGRVLWTSVSHGTIALVQHQRQTLPDGRSDEIEGPAFPLPHHRRADSLSRQSANRCGSTHVLNPLFVFVCLKLRRRTGDPQLRRLLISPFVHGDDVHLFSNMGSFLLKGVALELTMGTQAFAGLLAFTLLASQLLMVLAAWALLVVFEVPSPMQACTVGFSGVLFALTYVLSRRSPGVTAVSFWGGNPHSNGGAAASLATWILPGAKTLRWCHPLRAQYMKCALRVAQICFGGETRGGHTLRTALNALQMRWLPFHYSPLASLNRVSRPQARKIPVFSVFAFSPRLPRADNGLPD